MHWFCCLCVFFVFFFKIVILELFFGPNWPWKQEKNWRRINAALRISCVEMSSRCSIFCNFFLNSLRLWGSASLLWMSVETPEASWGSRNEATPRVRLEAFSPNLTKLRLFFFFKNSSTNIHRRLALRLWWGHSHRVNQALPHTVPVSQSSSSSSSSHGHSCAPSTEPRAPNPRDQPPCHERAGGGVRRNRGGGRGQNVPGLR